MKVIKAILQRKGYVIFYKLFQGYDISQYLPKKRGQKAPSNYLSILVHY